MACIAPLKPPWTAANTGGPPSRVSKRDTPNREVTTKTPLSRRSHSESRLSPGDYYQHQARARKMSMHLGDASNKENDTLRCRRRRPNKSQAGFSSVSSTSPRLRGLGHHSPRKLAPPSPQLHPSNCSVVASDTPHDREPGPSSSSTPARNHSLPTSGPRQERWPRLSPTPGNIQQPQSLPAAQIRPSEP
jgi:hypothetical protein